MELILWLLFACVRCHLTLKIRVVKIGESQQQGMRQWIRSYDLSKDTVIVDTSIVETGATVA